MLVPSNELLPGDKIISVPAWAKWKSDRDPNMVGAVVTEVVQEYVSHTPQVKFKGNFARDSFIAGVEVEIERAG